MRSRDFFFFFQAEDGIRDVAVTGVQTCALPIYLSSMSLEDCNLQNNGQSFSRSFPLLQKLSAEQTTNQRSEERRVGKECRSRWWRYHEKKQEEIGEQAKMGVSYGGRDVDYW